ncbi:SCAN domain-containing protein 3 [Trichonephila clavipes]|nr:SCAN domain-containing protein 3 [Trichonephila clavipes]
MPTAPISDYVTIGTGAHEQMFLSRGQSDAKPPVFSSQGESCDIKDMTQVALFVRYMSSQGPKEELLGLLPISGPTRAEIVEVMNLVIKIVNSLLKALYHRQFKEFLSEMKIQYSDLLLHNKVRWLSKEMQSIDLNSKALWSGKFTELKSKLEELEVQKCMYVTQQKLTALKEMPRVEALIFEAWNSVSDCYSEEKLTFGVLTIFGSKYS